MRLDTRANKRLSTLIIAKLEGHSFEVGVLDQNAKYKKPLPKSSGHKAFPKGMARKTGKASQYKISDIARFSFNAVGHNYFLRPFRRRDTEIMRFMKTFVNMFWKDRPKANAKRLENLIQAVVRNPIMRNEYGRNKNSTARTKGFNKKLIDTAQLFRAIKAKVYVSGRAKKLYK